MKRKDNSNKQSAIEEGRNIIQFKKKHLYVVVFWPKKTR
jgi:hypothetical protein